MKFLNKYILVEEKKLSSKNPAVFPDGRGKFAIKSI